MAAVPPPRVLPNHSDLHPLSNIIREIAATWDVLTKDEKAFDHLVLQKAPAVVNHDDPTLFYLKDLRNLVKTHILEVLQEVVDLTPPKLAAIELALKTRG